MGIFFSPLEPSSCLEFQGSGANQSPVTRCPRSPPSARAPLTLFRRTNHAVFDQFSCRFVFFSQLYTGVSLTHLRVRSFELSLPKQSHLLEIRLRCDLWRHNFKCRQCRTVSRLPHLSASSLAIFINCRRAYEELHFSPLLSLTTEMG